MTMPTPFTDGMRDWPQVLKRNAAVCELAVALYKSRGDCYGGLTDLKDAPASVRQHYITMADEILKGLEPRQIVTGLQGRVIGGINADQ